MTVESSLEQGYVVEVLRNYGPADRDDLTSWLRTAFDSDIRSSEISKEIGKLLDAGIIARDGSGQYYLNH